jgi:hypothetical protein
MIVAESPGVTFEIVGVVLAKAEIRVLRRARDLCPRRSGTLKVFVDIGNIHAQCLGAVAECLRTLYSVITARTEHDDVSAETELCMSDIVTCLRRRESFAEPESLAKPLNRRPGVCVSQDGKNGLHAAGPAICSGI